MQSATKEVNYADLMALCRHMMRVEFLLFVFQSLLAEFSVQAANLNEMCSILSFFASLCEGKLKSFFIV